MGAMDIAVESVWLLKYSSSIGLGRAAMPPSSPSSMSASVSHRAADLDWPWLRKNNGNLNLYQ
jgi:hypothetical protein